MAIKFDGFDVGSDWIVLVFQTIAGGSLVLRFTAGLLNTANTFRMQRAEAISMEVNAKTLKVEAEVIQKAAELKKELIDAARKDLAQKLADAFKNETTEKSARNEAIPLIENALDRWNTLLDNGATFQHALNAPKEITENLSGADEKLSLEMFKKTLPSLSERAGIEVEKTRGASEESDNDGPPENDNDEQEP